MERTKNSGLQPGVKMRWKKTGGGSLRLRNMRFIRPGEIFEAKVEDIPTAFRDTVILLDPIKMKEVVEKKEEEILSTAKASSDYSIQPRPVGGWVDVVDKNGKRMNEKALKLPAAEELLKSLKG